MIESNRNSFDEYMRLVQTSKSPTTFLIEGKFIVGAELVSVINVKSELCTRNYVGSNGEDLIFEVTIPRPVYTRAIHPNRDDLKFELTATLTGDTPGTATGERRQTVYNAYLIDNVDISMTAGHATENTVSDMNDHLDIKINCTLPIFDTMRKSSIPAMNYKNLDVYNLMKVLLNFGNENRSNVSGLNSPNYASVRGVDVIAPDNKRKYSNLRLDVGTNVAYLPLFLQEEYGVYATGCGVFFQRGVWFVYPLYNTKRFETAKRTLTILNVPTGKYEGMDKTYLLQSEQLYILCAGQTKTKDLSTSKSEQEGLGVAYSPSGGSLTGDFHSESGNKVSPRGGDKHKSFAVQSTPRGEVKVSNTDNYFTDNPFPKSSSMAEGLGTTMRLTWSNADPNLLFPGMATVIAFSQDNQIRRRGAVLLGVSYQREPASGNLGDKIHVVHATLTLFVANKLASQN